MKSAERIFGLLLTLILCLCALMPVRAEAAVGGTCGENATWSYDDVSKTLTISGTGAIQDYTNSGSSAPWSMYNWCALKLVIEEGITHIGNNTFNTMYGLQEISFPNTLKTIGNTVFSHCSGLTSIVIPDSVTSIGSWAFNECSELRSVTLSRNLQEIGACAFRYSGLTEITIPASVTEIGSQAFSGCEDLTDYRIAEGNTVFQEVGGVLYSADGTKLLQVPMGLTGSFSVPDGVTSIELYAFAGSKVTEVILPDGITNLPEGIFGGCESLTHVVLPRSLETMDGYAFQGTAVTRIVIPENVNTVNSCAFAGCTGLREVIFLGDEPYKSWYSIMEGTPEDLVVYYPADAWGWEDTWEERNTQPFTYTLTGTATCTSGGTQTITCEVLNLSETRPTHALGHALNVWTLVKAPSAGSVGQWELSCSRCGYAEAVSIPALAEENAGAAATNNKNDQNYSVYAKVINSYLTKNDAGYQRVEYTGKYITVEQYDEDYQLLFQKGIPMELTLFGGFYTNGTDHFLVFGQENPNEDNSVEVIRVVRYDVNWNRMDAASVYGTETCGPFDAGSLRMVQNGDYLYIRTSHLMYKFRDGLNHQSTLDILVYIPTMEVYDVDMLDFVSHSFNQFIVVDGSDLVLLDHCDTSPRGPLLRVWNKEAGMSDDIAVLECYGVSGQNATGASLGGLEVSKTAYLTVGNSIEQDGSVSFYGQRNVYVSAMSRESSETVIHWLTSYADGSDIDVSTPQLVKISDTRFLVLWTENGDTLKYVFVDQNGSTTSQIYSAAAYLSDCQPIAADGKVVWYVTNGSGPVFYSISLDDPNSVGSTGTHAHTWGEWQNGKAATKTEDGLQTRTCSECGAVESKTVAKLTDVTLSNPFVDVAETKFYYDPVLWASYNGITTGKTADTFLPEEYCTRSQIVTFLWRANGCPEPKTAENPFVDVQPSAYYYKAVLWAYENGITTGKDATHFQPKANCTRSQVVAFLWRSAEQPTPQTQINPFEDISETKYYYKAVLWAYENNITLGKDTAHFQPDGTCTRGQIVTFLYRFMAQ